MFQPFYSNFHQILYLSLNNIYFKNWTTHGIQVMSHTARIRKKTSTFWTYTEIIGIQNVLEMMSQNRSKCLSTNIMLKLVTSIWFQLKNNINKNWSCRPVPTHPFWLCCNVLLVFQKDQPLSLRSFSTLVDLIGVNICTLLYGQVRRKWQFQKNHKNTNVS